MARAKMRYGIDLGTTNSALCKIENGEPIIIKTDTQKDTLPSCISCKKRGIRVGDSAYNDLRMDRARATRDWMTNNGDVFIEFKRTMGLDTIYESEHTDHSFNSEELSAEVLKTLKSFVGNENIEAAVITVPAKFKADQIAATKRAAQLAGIKYCELLQEPIAASMAYGLTAAKKDGYWLVFDFGGGTFDAAIVHVEEGIMQVLDTEGDNYLGGKNLDFEIVDKIILPYLEKNYSINDIMSSDDSLQILRNSMKYYAEQAKNQLSFKKSTDITSQIDEFGEDDDGESLELDMVVTANQIENVVTPVFQKAIDIVKNLLQRNNLKGGDLDSLILVGGPTFSPALREMLKKQITPKIDVSIDPMTAVAKGAALYAAGIDYEATDIEKDTIVLDVEYESNTVESYQFVVVKYSQQNKLQLNKFFVEIIRSDKGWSSGKIKISPDGEIFECQLLPGRSNSFTIKVYDSLGNTYPCFPENINIMQGIVIGNAVLPYHIGIEAENPDGKSVFVPLQGLEKNKSLPAIGIRNAMKSPKSLNPGKKDDYFRIPIYQGEHNSEGTSAIYNDHVFDVVITGEDVHEYIPEDTNLDITLKVDASQLMKMEITLSGYDDIIEKNIEIERRTVLDEYEIDSRLQEAEEKIDDMESSLSTNKSALSDIRKKIDDIRSRFDSESSTEDGKMHLLADLRRSFLAMEHMENEHAWEILEQKIQDTFQRIEKVNLDLKSKKDKEIHELRIKMDAVLQKKDTALGKDFLKTLEKLFFEITKFFQLVGIFQSLAGTNFDPALWKNPQAARRLLDKGMTIINTTLDENDLLSVLKEIGPLLIKQDHDLIKL